MAEFDSVAVYALLNGVWVDLSSYVEPHLGFNFRWGISGERQDDILADTGEWRLSLKNSTGVFYPDGGSPLAGWGAGATLKLVYTLDGISYTRFKGHIPKNGLQLRVGDLSALSYVDVTVLDWIDHASETPIIAPDIRLNITADEVLEIVKDRVPAPVSLIADTGNNTFPAVFNSTGLHTYAYTEMSKLAYSESPGRIYLIKPRQSGEALVFENSTHRDTPTQKTTATLTEHYLLNSTGGFLLNSTGGKIIVAATTETDPTAVTFDVDDGGVDNVLTDYGSDVVNYATAGVIPKRIDKEPVILYRLPYPILLPGQGSYSFRAQYTDPQGGGRVNAIKSSMLYPEAPGGVDPDMKLLLHFTGNFTDSTGRHTVTNNDVATRTDAYLDVGPDPDEYRINGNVLGAYAILGGYASYNLSIADNLADFDFGSGPFTIGWYENILDTSAGNSAIARDGTSAAPPWILGVPDGTEMLMYMSSNGVSWDIASGKSLGQAQNGRWVHYEVARDENGWFYGFADGKLTDNWYSSASFPANANPLSIGLSQSTNYAFMGFDELYVIKGKILHKTDFDPPKTNLSHLLQGDYWLNTADDQTGTDLSDYLEIDVNYYSNEVEYVKIKNTSNVAGYFYVQARGRGVYSYDKIEKTVYDIQSINANNYQTLNINQPYQQDLTAGTEWITAIVSEDKDPKTKLRGIQFWANKSTTNMLRFLQCDIGDLIRVVISDLGIDGYYHIQNIGGDMKPGNLVYVTWGLVPGNEP